MSRRSRIRDAAACLAGLLIILGLAPTLHLVRASAGSGGGTYTTITFDEVPTSAVLSNQYGPEGIYFSSTSADQNAGTQYSLVTSVPSGIAQSGNQVAATYCKPCLVGAPAHAEGTFSGQQSYISVYVGDLNSDDSSTTVTLKGYDANGQVVAQSAPTPVPSGTGVHTQIAAAESANANIIRWDLCACAADGAGKSIAYDDLSFSTVAPTRWHPEFNLTNSIQPYPSQFINLINQQIQQQWSANLAQVRFAEWYSRYANPSGILLSITGVTPGSAWPPASGPGSSPSPQPVLVNFTIINDGSQPTTGYVTGDVIPPTTPGIPALTSGLRAQPTAQVQNLAPGQTAVGEVTLDQWPSAVDPPFGQADLILSYWTNDPNGTVSVPTGVDCSSGVCRPANYITIGVLQQAIGEIDLYPTCQPSGPDFLNIQSFSGPDFPTLDQAFPLNWNVASGGFASDANHVGSLQAVTLSGFRLPAAGIPEPISGSTASGSANVAGIRYVDLPKPGSYTQFPFTWQLSATGNCGTPQASYQPPQNSIRWPTPTIDQFTTSATKVDTAGQTVKLSWDVQGCYPVQGFYTSDLLVDHGFPAAAPWNSNCYVELKGLTTDLKQEFDLYPLPPGGSTNVQPTTQFNYYQLFVHTLNMYIPQTGPGTSPGQIQLVCDPISCQNNDTGFVTSTQLTVGGPTPQPTWSLTYFAVQDSKSEINPCFTIAVWAPNESAAESYIENAYGVPAADIQAIDPSEFTSFCST